MHSGIVIAVSAKLIAFNKSDKGWIELKVDSFDGRAQNG